MGLSLFITTITNLTNVGLLGAVLRKREGGPIKTHVFVFAGSIMALVFWATGNYMADTSRVVEDALFWTRMSFPLALFMCWFIYYFSCEFPIRKSKYRPILWLYLAFVVAFSIASYGTSVIVQVGIDPNIGISEVVVGSLYLPIIVLYLALIVHTTYNFVQGYRSLSGKAKAQTGYVLAGWSTFLFLAVFTNAILPFITGNANWSKFGPLGSIIMSSFIAYAIVRHEFLDVKVIIQRGLVYSILVSIIVGVYIVFLFLMQYIFSATTEIDAVMSAFVTALVGIFGVPPLTVFFQNVTARIFFKDRYDYVAVLSELASVLNENLLRDSIVKKSTSILERALKAETVVFCLESVRSVGDDTYAVRIPIKSNKKKIGMLFLGQKRSGDGYTHEDISLLNTFCSQAGVALEKANLYAKVKEYADTLELKVEERTEEIRRLQKEQESMMLEVSHGLQTPLTIMKGELFFLRKQGYATETIDTLDTSINRISLFIKKLLGLYRLEASSSRVDYGDVSLESVVENVVTSFAGEVREGEVELSTVITKDSVIQGNADELEEVLSNLLSNAVKYTDRERKNTICITLAQDNIGAVLTVSDTGIGIKDEYVGSLFKKFYRVKDETTKGVSGTGLGLVICKKIIEMHRGTIRVESEFGKGSSFIITLPRV